MFGLGAAPAVDFLPPPEAREWIARTLATTRPHMGPDARGAMPSAEATPVVRDMDGLFDLVCAAQSEIGQADVEFSLVEVPEEGPPVPPGFVPLGNPEGQLLHTFHKGGEYILLYAPALFRLPELVLSSVARELGRLGLHRAGVAPSEDPEEVEARAELAAVALGLGVWVANGAYVFENSCCGGGCGLDLSSIRAGLSMPEACFALALDAHHRDMSRRAVGKHLAPTQLAAFKSSYKHLRKHPVPLTQAAASPT